MKVTLSLPTRLLSAAQKALKSAASAEGGLRTVFTQLKGERPRGMDMDAFKRGVNALLNTFDRKTQQAKYDVRKQQLARAWRLVLGGKKAKRPAKRPNVAKFLAGKYTLRQLQRAVELKKAQ